MSKRRTRRHRRQAKAFLKFGATVRHRLTAGRTGSVHAKRLGTLRPR